ncbi:calcium-binding protein [Leptolyngbya sp. FACHB-671]|uniref:calcium-binding protein n=1 Tax=Leptolyngbya sp. FACHB-671 TaxID=2692812 RepID=UPI0016854CA6|nr:calcium-binding protein [Leptolyngbya sp. FACHB-671]MBD2067771.1 calcium-binding protein [Leptolyngbya sp. FACHB-671]
MATIIGTSEYDYLSGTDRKDSIIGLAGNDILDGDKGADIMDGGMGNDIYRVDHNRDVIIEGVDAGTDVVLSVTNNYTLSPNVENLELLGSANSGGGNALDNYISGNNSNNYLWGGAGNDTIFGGDTNFGAVTNDSDTMLGGDGNDFLIGGIGSDVLTGGAGADYFYISSDSNGIDRIIDFNRAEGDKFAISGPVFGGNITTETGAANGPLLSSQFVTGVGATNSDHRFIYNSSNGALFFDSDGTGASAQVQIASFSTGLALISSDIQVI